MSAIDRYMEVEEQREALRGVLDILLETEQIDHEVSRGIAKKIVADGDTEGLSSKQLDVFKKYIEPYINVKCEREGCGNEIDIRHLRESYENRDEFGGLYCVDCTIDMGRLKSL